MYLRRFSKILREIDHLPIHDVTKKWLNYCFQRNFSVHKLPEKILGKVIFSRPPIFNFVIMEHIPVFLFQRVDRFGDGSRVAENVYGNSGKKTCEMLGIRATSLRFNKK